MHQQMHERTAGAITAAEPVQPGAEWLRINDVRAVFGLARTTVYNLIDEGKVKSVCLCREGASKGVRLVSVASLRAYIESFATETPEVTR
jgi:hypothetical protein